MNRDRVAVILDISSNNKAKEEERDEKSTEDSASPPVYWIDGIHLTSFGIFFGFNLNQLFVLSIHQVLSLHYAVLASVFPVSKTQFIKSLFK